MQGTSHEPSQPLVRSSFFREITADLPLRITPGPFEVSPGVLEAAARPYAGHRSETFRRIVGEIRTMLLQAFEIPQEASYTSVVLTGTGTSAMEAMVAAVAPSHRPVVIVNGRFGRRLADITRLHNERTVVIDMGVGRTLAMDPVIEVLERRQTDLLLFCAQDTREAILNPIDELCSLARRTGHRLCVDAISATVTERLYAHENSIDLFSASSGKAIRGLPGLGVVCGKREVFEALEPRDSRTYYLNLKEHHQTQSLRSEPRFAPATALYYALHRALVELLAEGVESRRETILDRTSLVRAAAEDAGLEFLRPAAEMPGSVTSILLPPGYSYETFRRQFQARGFLVYSGSSRIPDCFQIGTAGYLTDEILREALEVLVQLLQPARRAKEV